MVKSSKIRAAVIGCGRIGATITNYAKAVQPGTHAGALKQHPAVELLALADVNPEQLNAAAKFFPGVKLYTDVKTMLAEIKPEIVTIATPTASHSHEVVLAARAKCPIILCEKPLAYTIKEGQKMLLACRQSRSQLFVNHQRHFDPLLLQWSAKVRNNFLGRIYQGNIYYYNGLFNNGTHWLDLLRLFLGDPLKVSACYNLATSSNLTDLNVDGWLYFKNELKVSLQSLSQNYGYFALRLFGEAGEVNVVNLGYEIQYRKKIANKNYKGFYQLSEPALTIGWPRSMMAATVAHLVKCYQGRAKPISTGQDGLAVLRILLALKKSADCQGREIKL